MRFLLLGLGIFINLSLFATIYEANSDGVATFSNSKLKNSKELDLSSDPVTVINENVSKYPKARYWGNRNPQRSNFYRESNEDTLQGSFPEQFTDNYYDFDGANHHYYSLMSSTIGMSMYSQNDANNMRLQHNY